jgi:hypothetical protein
MMRDSRWAAGCSHLAVAALALVLTAGASTARDMPQRKALDLRLRASDVKPTPPRPVPEMASQEEPLPAWIAFVFGADRPELDEYSLEMQDRMARGPIPNQARESSGEDGIGSSSFLKDLLDNQTIPLFRVTVDPPL